jgi:hypothetical protein
MNWWPFSCNFSARPFADKESPVGTTTDRETLIADLDGDRSRER